MMARTIRNTERIEAYRAVNPGFESGFEPRLMMTLHGEELQKEDINALIRKTDIYSIHYAS